MQIVLGTSAAIGFQLDLGELGDILLYPIAPYSGKAYYEERYCNMPLASRIRLRIVIYREA